MIFNCGHDERGKYIGGKAGDQTGKECYVRSWYNRPWTCVLRHPDLKVRAEIVKLARAIAKNECVGYDQGNRTSLWDELKKVGYNPDKIETPCETDCSASTGAIVKATGYRLNIEELKKVSKDVYSGNIRAALKNAKFDCLTARKYLVSADYLLAGDVLVYEGHHVAINLDDGSKVGKSDAGTEVRTNVQNTPFKRYVLSDIQVRGLAAICLQEQGCLKGVMAEASLMCNLFEKQNKYIKFVDYVLYSGWFAKAQMHYDKGVKKSVGSKYDEAVRKVICDGLRVFPNYIDEHDCFSDIEKATNNGKQINKKDRNAYKKGVTKIQNTYGSSYTFYCFPDNTCDPFGYIKKGSDDFCFDYDGKPINGDASVNISESKNIFPFTGRIVAKNGLNMRLQPNSNSKKATKTPTQPYGAKVTVVSETVNNENEKWYLVEKNGNRAYCYAKYVKKC